MAKFKDYSKVVKSAGKKKSEEEKNSSSSSSSKVKDYSSVIDRQLLAKTISLDTFESDLTSLNKTIQNIYNGWQTQETMSNTLASVQSMYDRLTEYQNYQKKYGGADLGELQKSYKSALDSWDDLSGVYGNFKNADAFNVAKKNAQLSKQFEGLTYDEVQAEKKKYNKTSDEYKFLDTYTGYTDLNDFNKALKFYDKDELLNNAAMYKSKASGIQNGFDISEYVKPSESGKGLQITDFEALKSGYDSHIKSSNDEYSNYLKSIGYDNESDFFKAMDDNRSYLIDLEKAKNQWELDHVFDLYKHYTEKEDFGKNSKYESTKGNYDNTWDKINSGKYGLGYGDLTYEYVNNVDGMRSKIDAQASAYSKDTVQLFGNKETLKDKGYDKLNSEEVATYNYIYKTEGKDKAQAFLDEMEMNLQKRAYDEQTKRWESNVDGGWGATLHSILSVPASVFGAIPTAIDAASDAIQGKEYNPYSPNKTLSNYALDTRKYVGENIAEATEGMELFGQNVPSFLYSTGMSIADNLLGANTLGSAFLPIMGTNAFHQKAKEMTEAGEDTETIYKTALASGAAEILFEKLSLDHFLKIKNVDGIGKIVTNTLKQAGIEASEEIGTELANVLSDYAIRGENSEIFQQYQDLIKRGFTEKEANVEVAKTIGSQVGWAGVGGFLSGGAMGPAGSIGNYIDNSVKGKEIKFNERVSDVFDIASNPEVASAYEAYTRYAKKGITTENISDVKLGNLYNSSKADATETLTSKKSTIEQKQGAVKTLARLSVVDTENTVAKRVKELNVGEETKVTNSDEHITIEGIKTSGDDTVIVTESGEVSLDDITLTQRDAELVSYAEQITRDDGEEFANLFLAQYDGETDVNEYANSFNLVTAYSKNGYTQDTILKNKGALTTDQVDAIYTEARIKVDRDQQQNLDNLNKKMADTMTYQGIIDDSIIDYENTSAKGKVNWNSLTERQRKSVTFIKGIAQATGMNLKFVANNTKYNGEYAKSTNTITINLDEGGFDVINNIEESIIPTMSHETTHWMEEKAPELWRKMNELVFSTLQSADGISEVDRIAYEIARLKRKGRTATEKEARSEIMARACEDMLSMSEQGKKMFNSLSESEQKTFVDKIKELIQNLKNWVSEFLGTYKANSYEAKLMRQYEDKLNELSKLWDEMLVSSVETNQSLEKSGAYPHDVTTIGARDLSELSEAVDTNGEKLFQYKAMVEDEEIYREMLLKHKDIIGITNKQIEDLFLMIDKAVDIISNNLEALDYAWDADIDDRAFVPVKPNSDSLYKVSLDFSTLCRKRLLQQTIQQTLQEALNKNLSKEESIAIRDELIKIQEDGRKIEVACALCYVESARMKSPKQINKFLNNRESIIRDFFANRSGGSTKEKVAKAELRARKELAKANPDGYFGKNDVKLDVLTAPKSRMKKADADYIRAEGKKAKSSYKLTAHEQAELDAAINMGVNDFTSAKGLENLAKHHKDLFDAYTSFVRNATHSKGIENDTWWRAGDSDSIGDNLIAQMNAENGLRSQSWSDFQVIHLLDYIAATIELSTKGTKRQSYTKVPDYVKLLGNTGDMINISLIPERVFNGELSYDGVEGMAYDIAKQLRDEYHETVGTICIGIENEQIRMLLEDITIDMVIPYHHSSMSKETRKLMHIPTWITYEKSQNESKLSDADAKARAKALGVEVKVDSMYQKSPIFSEWFNLEEARQIAKLENEHPSNMDAYKKYGKMYGGYMAMQNAANNYLKLCAERGLAPKFSSNDANFTKEANYWKLLIDRKMVDNITGEIIEQKPIKPIFNEKHVLEILNDELARYPQVKADQEYAQRKVVEKFLSGNMKVDKSTLDAIQNPINNITEVNILESSKDMDSNMEIIDIPFGMYSKMQKHFGTTKNFDVAGYLLRDGTMLDFSGKHWGDTTSTFRQVDHRDIQEVLEDDNNGVQAMMSMISNGNIRLMPEVGGINLSEMPNGFQHSVLRDYINHFKGEVIIDIDAVGGDTIHSFEYSKGTSASKILSDLHDYFHKGTIPSHTKSSLADFLYSDKDSEGNKPFSYDELIKKGDLKGIVIYRKTQVKLSNNANIDADWVVKVVKGKCKILKPNPSTTTYYTNVPDIDRNVEITKKGITHGFMKSLMDKTKPSSSKDIINARVSLEIPEILRNSIEVNRSSRVGNIDIPYSHIMIGTVGLEDDNGNVEYYAVRSVIEERINQNPILAEAEILGKLHAVNAKKIGTPHVQVTKNGVALARSVAYTYKISQFLEDVKTEFGDTFSNDVYQKLAMNRKANDFSKDLLYSDKDNVGYHAGDLGKSESLGQQGRYRDTGHFGTGTYFVGNKELVRDYNRRDGVPAPQHAVDFSGYNLYKVKNDKDGYALHRQLQLIDGGITEEWVDAAKDDKFSLYRSTEYYYIAEEKFGEEGKYSNEALIYGLTELAKKAGIEIPTREQYSKESGYELDEAYFDSVYKDHLEEVVGEQLEEINDAYAEFRDAYSALEMRFGFSGQVYEAMNKVLEYQNANRRDTMDAYKKDSLATVFMKALGYEGVDTRGTGLDNTAYGSVIYDLKEDTVLYSDKEQSVYDLMGETDRVRNENDRLNIDVGKLNEIIGTTESVEIPNRKFLSLANYLKKLSGSNIDSAILGNSLKDAYTSIQTSDSLNWNDIARKTYGIAESIMSNDMKVPVDYFTRVMQEIRKDKISLSEEQRERMEKRFGGYGNFHKYVFGRTNITKDGKPLTEAWKNWSKIYPSLFDANLNGAEQIDALVELVSNLKATNTLLSEYERSEAIRHLSTEIYNQFWNIAADSSTLDSANIYRREHKTLMETLRKDYEKRQKDLAVHPVGETALKYDNLLKKVQERKKKEVAKAKELGREKVSEYKENAERKTQIQRITANALTLNKWLTQNSKDYHIHEAMKGPVVKLLNAIDFSSKRMLEKGDPTQKDISFVEAFSEVRAMLQDADNMVEGLESLYGHDLAENIKLLSESAYRLVGDNNYVINAMSLEELQSLDKLVRHIKKVVTDLNKFHTIHHNQGAISLANEFMEHGEKLGNIKKQHGKMGKFFEFRNRTPYYFFKDLGNVGKKLFEAFQDGWDKLAFNSKKVIDFAEETYTTKEVKQWSKETKEFKLTQFDGSERTIKMSIAQIMALHCVSKQEDAQRHLLLGGMTLKRIDKKGHVVADYENINLSLSDIRSILSTLDDRQREVADKLQKFMNTECSAWGNEISMERFGIEMFGLPDYFPIKVSEATVPTDNSKDIDNASLFRLLNMSFTKARNQKAEQSIEIGDIFDIFAQHASDMAKYNALALPVLDFNKFYSIHGKDIMGKEYGVVKTLKSVFGDEANGYLRRFVRDLNGSQNVSRDVIGNTFFKNSKVAAVAANLRVILLQPTAFYKASAVLDNKYLMKASAYMKYEPVGMFKRFKKAIANAEKYCGIVQWKSLGYYDTDISKGITEKIKHSETIKDKLVEKSLKGAEIADKVTFGTLWVACEFEIKDTRKDLKVGSGEYYKAVSDRLRDVIYATQVVDSTMTRSDMMRSSDGRDKMLTTFGSEPTIAYNMLLDMVTQLHRDTQEHGKKEAMKRNAKKIRKVVTAYTITNMVAALVESGFDALRDDDDEEMDVAEFMKLYLKNFAFDMSIGNKLPYIKELYSLMQGYSSSRMDTQWAQYLFKVYEDFKKIAEGEGNRKKTTKDSTKAISDMSGLPFYNILRDALAILDKLGIFDLDE